MPQPTDPVHVSLLVVPESTPGTLFGLFEVLASVGTAWSTLTGEPQTCRQMKPQLVSASPGPFACSLGIPITPHATLEQVARTDVIIVGDLALNAERDPHGMWVRECGWIRRQFDDGAMVCSVCTGTVMLAGTGLLDDCEATTHWSATELFRAHFPRVKLRPERVLLPTGPEHRIVTSGGAASWEDLVLYLIARFCGEMEAVRTSRIFLFGDRSEGQAPYAAMRRPRRHEDALIAECQAWLASRYTERNPVASMLERSGLNARTFNRRFRAATGYSPLEYVQALRIEEAKHLLLTTDASADAVAGMVGYDDPRYFYRLFKRRTSVTPARYRRRFQYSSRR